MDHNLQYEAQEINELFNTINEIENELYFHPGEIVELNDIISSGGLLTSSSTSLGFEFSLPKSTEKISTIILEEAKGNVRISSGGYLNEYTEGGADYIALSSEVITYNLKRAAFKVGFEGAWFHANNYPFQARMDKLRLRFE